MIEKKEDLTVIKVAIVNYDKALASSIMGMLDIFAIVNTFCLDNTCKKRFETKIVHTECSVVNFNMNINFNSEKLNFKEDFDLIIVPPIIDVEFNFNDNKELIFWLQEMSYKGILISSVCVGAYILAQAGLLDYKKATSHWVIEQKLKQDYPLIKLDVDKLIVEDDNIITAGGASAYIHLCLYIVRKFISIDVAYICANFLGVDAGKSSQQHYKNLSNIATHNDKEIQSLIDWIKNNYTKTITLKDMSAKISTSQRTLIRKFKKATGELPNYYLQKLRVQKAKQLLISTNDSFEYITYLVGYTNTSTFRSLFKNMTGLNPGDYRKYFMVK